MMNEVPHLFIWMERFIAFAVVLQTVELLQIRKSFGEDGIWSWKIVGREYSGAFLPLRFLLNALLNDRTFIYFLFARVLLAVVAPFLGCAVIWALLWFSTLLIAMRWRGTFNGGSDYMTLIVLMSLSAGRAFGENHPFILKVAIGYVGLQLCLSYFIAGFAKLKRASWRNGSALTGFLSSEYYCGKNARFAVFWAENRQIILVASWALILFECLFPLALLNPKICLIAIGFGAVFQIGNTYFFGLNRFLWAWAAAYPALYWCSLSLAGMGTMSTHVPAPAPVSVPDTCFTRTYCSTGVAPKFILCGRGQDCSKAHDTGMSFTVDCQVRWWLGDAQDGREYRVSGDTIDILPSVIEKSEKPRMFSISPSKDTLTSREHPDWIYSVRACGTLKSE